MDSEWPITSKTCELDLRIMPHVERQSEIIPHQLRAETLGDLRRPTERS